MMNDDMTNDEWRYDEWWMMISRMMNHVLWITKRRV